MLLPMLWVSPQYFLLLQPTYFYKLLNRVQRLYNEPGKLDKKMLENKRVQE